MPLLAGVAIGVGAKWVYDEFFKEDEKDSRKEDSPPPKKKLYLLYGLSGTGKTELRNVLIDREFKGTPPTTQQPDMHERGNFGLIDCTGTNHSLNNEFIQTNTKDFDECFVVYVFSAAQYLKEPEIAQEIKDRLGIYTKMMPSIGVEKVFALGTHSPSMQHKSYVPSQDEHGHIIQELQNLALVRIFELKESPYSQIERFLGIS
ncbi:GTPase domain-containing protein [Helicobacter cynogastricus]|uniref:GTPase domain-containing protein n=1 Tax=Helicobacter cynogastricus TaxID=329937 RepID=UPI000CF1670C|nr:GTPase domain-containing protein [Helicobacter cynogastricus]